MLLGLIFLEKVFLDCHEQIVKLRLLLKKHCCFLLQIRLLFLLVFPLLGLLLGKRMLSTDKFLSL